MSETKTLNPKAVGLMGVYLEGSKQAEPHSHAALLSVEKILSQPGWWIRKTQYIYYLTDTCSCMDRYTVVLLAHEQ